MRRDVTVGQESIKKTLLTQISLGKVPHAQCFIDAGGRGGLALALDCAFALLFNEIPDSLEKCLQHPDLQFVFPVAPSDTVKRKPSCADYMSAWRSFVENSAYGSLSDWLIHIGANNTQGNIGVLETEKISKALSLKAYLGKNKVCLMWGVERMNVEAANKLLKLIEEPPKDTYFFLIVDDEEALLPTIRSRCQRLGLPPLKHKTITQALLMKGCSPNHSENIAKEANGNLHTALDLLQHDSNTSKIEARLIDCLRLAFRAKRNKSVSIDLMQWSNTMGQLSRNDQKAFLSFGLRFIRQALLVAYQVPTLVNFQTKNNFSLEKFAPYIHSKNALGVIQLFEEGLYAVERNANGKVLFADFCIQLTRLLDINEN